MKSATAGTASGCVVWVITFCVLSACLVPAAATVGVVASVSGLTIDFVASTLGPYICPQDSTADIVTTHSSGVDTDGVRYNSTSYEMQCLDSNGNVVKEPSQDYVPIWLGILAVAGLILSALLALLLAAPAGVLIASLSSRMRKGSPPYNN